jgi:enamine deaminase RidA (YjgF/YER057c/UK114 family)
MADFDAMNAVWEAWIDPDNPPARMTYQARLARATMRIEVMVTAAV